MKAAQKAAFEAQDDQAVMVKSKMVGGIAQVKKTSVKPVSSQAVACLEAHYWVFCESVSNTMIDC